MKASRVLALICALLVNRAVAEFDYRLSAREAGEDVYVINGRMEHFNRSNGGDIANTGFILTPAGAVVIDSGPSRLYGEQQRRWIEAHGGVRVARVYITHAHPDHFLGNQAYAGIPIFSLPATRAAIIAGGERMADNLYRLIGGAMSGTQAVAPAMPASAGSIEVGGRRLRLIAGTGHTAADLAVFDEASATLFAGDLVFYQRAPTTPNADIARWLSALASLEAVPYKTLVPGHGPVVHGPQAIEQTRDYLHWLRASLSEAAQRGADLPELGGDLKVPERFRDLAVLRAELGRSAEHLYPEMELEALQPTKPAAY